MRNKGQNHIKRSSFNIIDFFSFRFCLNLKSTFLSHLSDNRDLPMMYH